MIDELEIYRSARLLIDGLGADRATVHASETADQMLARGDMDGKLVWLAILRALEELQRTEARRRGRQLESRGSRPCLPSYFPRRQSQPISTLAMATPSCSTASDRIENVDAPELFSPRCESERRLAIEAKRELERLLAVGSIVLKRRAGKDRHGRTIAMVSVNGKDVGKRQLRPRSRGSGAATVWPGAASRSSPSRRDADSRTSASARS
jgi:endonuclease YncB( thermonuclease family)